MQHFLIHYTLEEISEERRTGYAWQRSFGIPAMIERAERILELGREKWQAEHKALPPTAAQKAARASELEPAVRELVTALDEKGRWVTPAARKYQGLEGPWVEMGTFSSHLRTLCEYLDATSR